jgi:3-oxoacyl-[acyl-carrier protein] reductase
MILTDKVAILTGAGRGIGRVIAEEFAREGSNLALISRTRAELEETLELVRNWSKESFCEVCDISDPGAVKQLVRLVTDRFGRVDILVNNAGVQSPIGSFAGAPLEAWKKAFEVNLFGTANMTHAVLPCMVHQRSGKIINLSGGGATSARPNFSAYGVSKTAIVRFTETVAEELRRFHIDVNAVAPGVVKTRMLEEVLQAGSDAGDELAVAQKCNEAGGEDPRIAAALIAFLASSEADGITGKLISAIWDPWREAEFRKVLREDRNFATLRRIDEKYFGAKK